ncbi:hypothetical protein [Mycoplasma leonicaptivi]|uniref:hypothetical protein n=1 Tax=Mycoplasma leonicaptivi TaxID=36742 RepID=UPI0005644008|nr:hypothetical protein [Mycoplasma leonicaptivi]
MKFKSEQINLNGKVIIDYDQPILKKKEFFEILNTSLQNTISEIKYQGKKVFCYFRNNIKHYFICVSLTYLGNPHPIFKKKNSIKKMI